MGEAYIVRRGGGSAGLNFRVIGGTTAPANPKENDIWVNTDVKIPNWAFCSEEPDAGEVSIDCAIGLETTYIAADGTETYYSASIVTEYIKLPDNTAKITVSNTDLETANMHHAFYTADKTLISTVERKKGETTYEVPTDAVYVRLTVYNSRDPMTFAATLGMEDGFVWFNVSTSSAAAFNALKKNSLWVYPLACQQYVSGAGVDKTAKTYQNGAWVDWTIYIYWLKNGSLTGSLASANNASVTDGLITINVSGYNNACFVIDAPQDLTGAKKLCVKAKVESLSSQYPPTFGIKTSATIDQAWASRGFAAEKQITATNSDFTAYTLELNKAFSGNHYFGFSGIAKITISEIWIEK